MPVILVEETKKRFNYDPDALNKHSRNLVVVQCDYCGGVAELMLRRVLKARKYNSKDTCAERPCANKKRKETSLIRYGVDTPSKDSHVKQKALDTCVKRYGTQNASQSEEIKAKIKRTFIGKYGVSSPFKHESVKNKFKQTMQKRYGVDNPSNIPSIAKARGERLKSNYQNEDKRKKIIDKTTQTNRIRTGKSWHFQDVEQKKKHMLSKYGVENPMQCPEILKKSIDTRIKSGIIKTYNGKTITDFSDEMGLNYTTFQSRVLNHGFEDAIAFGQCKSTDIEKKVSSLLESLGISYVERKPLWHRGYRPDFLTEKNVIIEVDGEFWHSDRIIKDKCYHQKKRSKYLEMGYIPVFFRGSEVRKQFPIVVSIIKNKLGISDRVIYARKTKIIELHEPGLFFTANHLMGKGAGRALGLSVNGETVASMQVKNRGNGMLEISRFCTLLGCSVVGGFSKLLAHIVDAMKPKSIMTFVDLRYGLGNYLPTLGFKLQSEHLSFVWTNGSECFHRMKFPGNSGYEHGLCKIWDCGQAKYAKEI